MKFEEIISHLRAGKKVYHKIWDENGEYWQSAFVRSNLFNFPKKLTVLRFQKNGELIKINGFNNGSVMIPASMILDDDWEIKYDIVKNQSNINEMIIKDSLVTKKNLEEENKKYEEVQSKHQSAVDFIKIHSLQTKEHNFQGRSQIEEISNDQIQEQKE